MLVHVREALSSLEYDLLDDSFREFLISFPSGSVVLVDVDVHVFEDHVKLSVDFEDFLEFDDVRMAELAEGFYFLEGHAFIPSREVLFHLFDSDFLPSGDVNCFHDCAVRAVAEVAS